MASYRAGPPRQELVGSLLEAFVGGVFVLPGEVGTGRIVAPALVPSCGCEARTAHWSTAGRKAAVGHGGRQPTEFLSRSGGTARSAQESPWHPGRTGPWSGLTVASGVPGRGEAEPASPLYLRQRRAARPVRAGIDEHADSAQTPKDAAGRERRTKGACTELIAQPQVRHTRTKPEPAGQPSAGRLINCES